MHSGLASIQSKAFRKQHNLWLAYASEMAAPALRLAARATARGSRTEPPQWRRGLILGHTHVGDVLYRTCSLPTLCDALPDCEWTYAVSGASRAALHNNPDVDEILPVIRGENSWDLVPGGFAELASRRFDVALCSNTLRHHPDLALATALGIPNRVGFVGKGLSGLINHQVALNFPDAYPGYFRSMVAAVAGRAADWPLTPRMYPSAGDQAKASDLWKQFGFDASRLVVACSLRTRQAKGNWPEDVLLSVLKAARNQREFDVVLCGAPSDEADMRSIASALPFTAHILAGRAGLSEFAAFLSMCSALLTLDSGPRHIGNAMRIPVLFARNLSHSQVEAGRYCETETDLAPSAEHLKQAATESLARAQPVDRMSSVLLQKLGRR